MISAEVSRVALSDPLLIEVSQYENFITFTSSKKTATSEELCICSRDPKEEHNAEGPMILQNSGKLCLLKLSPSFKVNKLKTTPLFEVIANFQRRR